MHDRKVMFVVYLFIFFQLKVDTDNPLIPDHPPTLELSSRIIVGAAFIKMKLIVSIFLGGSTTNDAGHNVSLFIHLVYNGDGARLPA